MYLGDKIRRLTCRSLFIYTNFFPRHGDGNKMWYMLKPQTTVSICPL